MDDTRGAGSCYLSWIRIFPHGPRQGDALDKLCPLSTFSSSPCLRQNYFP